MNLCTHVWEYILAFFSLRPGELVRSSLSPGISQLGRWHGERTYCTERIKGAVELGNPKIIPWTLGPWWHLLIPYPDPQLLNFSPLFQFKRLQGKRNRGREEINFVEIKGDDQLSGAQQWMTKSLTEEKTMKSFSKVSGKERSTGWPPWESPKQNLTPHLIVTVPTPLANTCFPWYWSAHQASQTQLLLSRILQHFALYLDGSLVAETGRLEPFPVLQLGRSQYVWLLPAVLPPLHPVKLGSGAAHHWGVGTTEPPKSWGPGFWVCIPFFPLSFSYLLNPAVVFSDALFLTVPTPHSYLLCASFLQSVWWTSLHLVAEYSKCGHWWACHRGEDVGEPGF